MNARIDLSLKICFFLSLFLFVGCTSQQRNKEATMILKGTVMTTDSLFNGSYFYNMQGEYLIMRSYDKDSLIQILEVDDTRLNTRRSMMSKGQGPFDVQYCSVYVQDSTITVLDFNSSIQKCFEMDYISAKLPFVERCRQIPLSNELKKIYTFGSSEFVVVNDSCFLVLGGRQGHKEFMSLYFLNTGKVIPLDCWPDDGFEADDRIKQSVYFDNSHLFKSRKQNRYLYNSGNGQILLLFDIDENGMTNLRHICCNYPQYKIREDGINFKMIYPTEDSKRCLDVATTERFIYVKTSPHNYPKEYKGYPFYYGDNITVYDWEGKKVNEFETDRPFNTFVVDDEDRYLYTEGDDLETGDVVIFRYELVD